MRSFQRRATTATTTKMRAHRSRPSYSMLILRNTTRLFFLLFFSRFFAVFPVSCELTWCIYNIFFISHFLLRAAAMDLPSEVFPTPGGPTRHRMDPLLSESRDRTAMYSTMRCLTCAHNTQLKQKVKKPNEKQLQY